MEIETERLLLRGWRDGDVEPYARLCADPEVMRFIGDGSTLTREGSEGQISRFVRHWDERGFGLWALEEKEGGTFVGFAGLAHQEDWVEGEHKTEVGWRLDRAFWGRGLATEAANASVDYGIETLGLERIISIIQPGNTASRRGEGRAHPAWRDSLEGHARRLVRDRPRAMGSQKLKASSALLLGERRACPLYQKRDHV